MPNWTSNSVTFHGPNKEDIIALMGKDFDFNKVLPMPESLNIESGSKTDEAIVIYLTDKLRQVPYPDPTDPKMDALYTLVKSFFGEDKNYPQKLYERIIVQEMNDDIQSDYVDMLYPMGKTYVENWEKYGAITWYEWRNREWGVKWPASEVTFDDGRYEFETPWTIPDGVFRKLSEKFPDTVIRVEAQYEDDMDNIYLYEYLGGNLIKES